jgi:hypothetical protein
MTNIVKKFWEAVAVDRRRIDMMVFRSDVARLSMDFGWPPATIDREVSIDEVRLSRGRLGWNLMLFNRPRMN